MDCVRLFLDPTLVVAALIVMEFLIADQDVTDEISACIGVTKPSVNEQITNIHELGEDEVIELGGDEEIVVDDDEFGQQEENLDNQTSKQRISWLLQVALENLGVTVCSYIVRKKAINKQHINKPIKLLSISIQISDPPKEHLPLKYATKAYRF